MFDNKKGPFKKETVVSPFPSFYMQVLGGRHPTDVKLSLGRPADATRIAAADRA